MTTSSRPSSTPSPSPLPPGPVTIPLSAEQRAAYKDLYDKYEATIETTTDVGVLETFNASQTDVGNILTKDDEYRLAANTALYKALQEQINSTNIDLKALKKQIMAITNGVSTFADVLAAIDKVLTLVPGV